MIAKLFASFPPQPDVALRAEAYFEAFEGIPWRWVSRGLHSLVTEPGRVFCPSVPEVVGSVARLVRQARRKSDPSYVAHLAAGGESGDAAELRFLRGEVSASLERGVLPPGVSAEDAKAIAPSGEWEPPL